MREFYNPEEAGETDEDKLIHTEVIPKPKCSIFYFFVNFVYVIFGKIIVAKSFICGRLALILVSGRLVWGVIP